MAGLRMRVPAVIQDAFIRITLRMHRAATYRPCLRNGDEMSRDLTTIVCDGFRAAFDREPLGVWSAPGRVSIMGDHTDLQDGVGYACAIPLRSSAAIAPREDGRIRIVTDLSMDEAVTDLRSISSEIPTQDWRAYPLGAVASMLRFARENPPEGTRGDGDETDPGVPFFLGTGLEIFLTTDIPIGAGLASSASICATISTALNDFWGLGMNVEELAEIGRQTEADIVGAPGGLTDHITVHAARSDEDVFFDARGSDVSILAATSSAESGLARVLIDTKESHRNWSAEFATRAGDCARAAEVLGFQTLREVRPAELDAAADKLDEVVFRRARHVVSEIARTLEFTKLMRTGESPEERNHLLAASQTSLREDFEVSTARIDFTVELATYLGAASARMTGTGLGGSVFVMHPVDKVEELRESVLSAYAEQGWEAPLVLSFEPEAGARRDR